MKLKNRIMTFLISIFMIAMMIPSVAMAAGPIETDRDVTVTFLYKDDTMAISGGVFDFYRCADVDAFGQMTVTDAFSSYPVYFDRVDKDGWQEMATTLKGYVQRDNLDAEVSGTTDNNGELSCTLKPGVYLVVGKQHTIDDYTYTPMPLMIFLPGSSEKENVWKYDVDITVKYSKKYNPPEENVITRKVIKVWDDYGYEYARPDEITVQLLKDGTVYDTQTLSEKNLWRYTWDDLSDQFEWMIVEKEVDGYATKVTQEGIAFIITNQYLISLVTEDPHVAKKVIGDTPDSASTFTFVLTAADASYPMPDGSTGTTKKIKIKGSGSREFGVITFSKPGTYTYSVFEKNTKVKGYTYDTTVYTIRYLVTEQGGMLVSQRSIVDSNGKEVDSLVFTNKYKKPVPSKPSLPQTGMTWWPIPLFFCLGLAFYVVGFLWRRKQRDDE